MKKTIKISLALGLAILLMLTIVACGNDHESLTETISPTESTPTETIAMEESVPIESTQPSTVPETTAPIETVPTEPACAHEYQQTLVAPTCTEAGYTTYVCSICSDTYNDNDVAATGHKYGTKTIAPTYTDKGYDEHTCEVCGDKYEDNWQDKIPHEHKYSKKVTNPTCTSKGYTTSTCDLCGEKITSDYTDKLAHKYTKKVKEPTCVKKGYTTYTCSCGKSYKDNYTDKVPHKYSDKTIAPTCTTEGYTLHTCKVCKYEYKDNTVAKTPHVFEKYNSDGNATCLTDGTKTAKCNGCNAKDTVADPGSALGHKIGDWKSAGADYHERKCQRDGCNFAKTKLHDCVLTEVIAPTCTEKGYTRHYCKCGHEGLRTDYTDATGHDYETKTVTPTYVDQGYDLHTCKKCQHSYKDNYVDKIPHDCDYENKVVSPTCTEKGYTMHTCKLCGAKFEDTPTNALGHDYETKVKEPTCTEEGYTTYTCKRCSHSYKDNKKDKIGHDYKKTTVEPTTGWKGYDLYTCKNCGYSYKDNEKAKLPSDGWPKGYKDSTGKITIYKEWYENAYCYAAHIEFTDYKRLATASANGKYNSGLETTSHAAKRIGAIFCVNGDYAIPSNGAGGYCVARNGKVCNNKPVYSEGIYNHHTGLLTYRTHDGVAGNMLSDMVKAGKVTDTFQFGPALVINGKIQCKDDGGRAQRTFIGTNGKAGDIWVVVSDGRKNDGKSSGLTGYQCAKYLKDKGCSFVVPLDGGGSSTMYFDGKVLNAAKSGQRKVADFLYFK